VAIETNEETIQRVVTFIRDQSEAVTKLGDGSFYHGAKL